MCHYAKFHRCISQSVQTGESGSDDIQAGEDGKVFSPPLESHSTQVFMLASRRIVEGLLLSQEWLTGVFNWELVLAGLL